MIDNFIAKSSTIIDAPVSKVWNALINPKTIKQYLFGTEAVSDWKEGSPITYRGTWEGKNYEDKGRLLKIVPEKLLVSTYWSSMSGLADLPENYSKVTYELSAEGNQTKLSLLQDNNVTEEARKHSEENWSMVLKKIKEILEQ